MNFIPNLKENFKNPLYIQLYNYIKNEILLGNMKPGEKLPSVRQTSEIQKISRTTVETAYNQLLVEGYIESFPRKGYYISNIEKMDFQLIESRYVDKFLDSIDENKDKIIFINDSVDKNSFDFYNWKRLYNKVISQCERDLLVNGDMQGELILRKEINKFVYQTRGVVCSPEQIVVGAGVQYLLGILVSIIKNEYYSLGVENPGFVHAQYIFEDYNYKIHPIPVEEDGIDILSLQNTKTKMVYISPSHQYPTGSVMPINKRLKILNWANSINGLVIEDDYDSLLRYETKPIPSLQGLDKGANVVYLGSFSKILLPSLRISYMILPKKLLKNYQLIKDKYAQTTSKFDQLTLAYFMIEGYFDRHLRRINKIYRRKNQRLIQCLNEIKPDNIKILGKDSGLHVLLEVDTEKKVPVIIEDAKKQGINLEVVKSNNQRKVVVVFTYSGLQLEEIEEVVERVIRVF